MPVNIQEGMEEEMAVLSEVEVVRETEDLQGTEAMDLAEGQAGLGGMIIKEVEWMTDHNIMDYPINMILDTNKGHMCTIQVRAQTHMRHHSIHNSEEVLNSRLIWTLLDLKMVAEIVRQGI